MGDIALQDTSSSRTDFDSQLSKKPWRQRLFSLFRKPRHGDAEFPRNSVHFPLVDAIPSNGDARCGKPLSNPCSVAQRLDEFSVGVRHDGTIGIIFRVVNEEHSHDLNYLPSHTGDMADEYAIECGIRLRKTREALGFNTLRRFAQSCGVQESRYSKWELGGAMVPPSFVRQLRDNHDITFDWIYGDDNRRLPNELVVNLRRQS